MYFHYLLFTTLYKFHVTKTHMVHLTVCMHICMCVLKIITRGPRIVLNWPNARLCLRSCGCVCVFMWVCVFDTFFRRLLDAFIVENFCENHLPFNFY